MTIALADTINSKKSEKILPPLRASTLGDETLAEYDRQYGTLGKEASGIMRHASGEVKLSAS